MTAFPRSPITGVTPWVGQEISGAQNLSGWSKSLPAHWGLTLWKIASGAVQQPRLALPNQRSRCVSWREPQGPPLQRDYVYISRKLLGDRKGRPYGVFCTGAVGSETAGAVVEPHRQQFLQPQGPVARQGFRPTTPFLRARDDVLLTSRVSPVMGVWGKAVIGERSSPLRRPPASFGFFSTWK